MNNMNLVFNMGQTAVIGDMTDGKHLVKLCPVTGKLKTIVILQTGIRSAAVRAENNSLF